MVLPLDVTDQASVDTTIKKVTDEVGAIDVLNWYWSHKPINEPGVRFFFKD